MLRDPRSHRRYTTARATWLAGYGGRPQPCCLCGGLVDVTLPGSHDSGPTVEHRLPIREILDRSRDNEQALALACDTSLWALAHKRCQSRQGGAVRRKRRPSPVDPAASRDW